MPGHKDIVLSIDVSHDGTLVASSGKDHEVRVWDLEHRKCLAVCVGHNEAVGAVSFPNKSNDFLVSGSKDRTIKCWDIKGVRKGSEVHSPSVSLTEIAHEKDINCIAFAPNDSIFATASQVTDLTPI